MAAKIISVVDDDRSLRESLEGLLSALGYQADTFSSAEEFLKSEAFERSACLILDVTMPGMSGPDLQRHLIAQQDTLPIIFITARGEGALAARVIADGAIDCLLKPFSEGSLLDAIERAFRFDRHRRPSAAPITPKN